MGAAADGLGVSTREHPGQLEQNPEVGGSPVAWVHPAPH